MKHIYESMIDMESIRLLDKINNNRIIKINRDSSKNINDIYVKLILFTEILNVEITADINYSEEYDEFSKIIVRETDDEEFSLNGKMEEVTMNQNIKSIYIYRDIVELSNGHVLIKDKGLIFELEEYYMGYFVSDFISYTLERINFKEESDIYDIYSNIKEYKDSYGDMIVSYKREKKYINELMEELELEK